MDAHIIDVFDEIAVPLLEPRNLFTDAMLQAALDRHPLHQPACMRLTRHSVWPKRFDFGVLEIAAQDISQSDDVPTRKFVQPIVLSIMRIDAWAMGPTRAVLAKWGK